jgi:peptide/nickel transport system permease protein
MSRFVVRRIFSALIVMFAITVLTFLLLLANGNQAARLAGRNATAAQVHTIEVKYGFNKPIYEQYLNTMKNIFTGQAYSYTQGVNVLTEVKQGLPATLSLAFGAGFIWLILSIIVGTLAAVRAGKYTDRILTILAMLGVSFPPFFLGAILIYFLGYKANLFPLGGYVKFTTSPWEWFKHLVLPWITLSVLFIGFYSRVLRSTILDTINEDYIRTAHAKGVSERRVLVRHALRNAAVPIVSVIGIGIALLISGVVITESVFNLPGLGRLTVDAVLARDYPVIQGVILLFSAVYILINLAVDVSYTIFDPRIRY